MSTTLQAKLLKVLQERTFERLGSLSTLKTNARVIAATNRDLKQMVGDGIFREDLYYRLNVFPILIPTLRDRKSHLQEIAHYLVNTISRRLGKETKTIPEAVMKNVMEYQWPGSIRELENVIERALIVAKGTELNITVIGEQFDARQEQKVTGDLKAIEKKAISNALSQTSGNRRGAAEMLGISLRSLQYKIKEYGIA